ncbi:MAG: DUF969 domain-containing protein [Sodalis sp. (in: enterobacteria)]|uniref:DUF969 domain-containing protein n=1 Tax=Sodalis sp. (in: enterobacteria) TaxID=1898979 RepID=UPI003F2E7263
MWPSIGIVILGFALHFNPLVVVTLAGLITGLTSGLDLPAVVSDFGTAYVQNRYMTLIWLALPVIGLLEQNGLREQSQRLVIRIHTASLSRILILYMLMRQLTAALGLTALGGHTQMVRPLMAPMAEGAARKRLGDLPQAEREKIRAHSAAVDNIGVFLGETIFIAIGSILLMKGFMEHNGYIIEPLHFAVWAIPTAFFAFIIHSCRVTFYQRALIRRYAAQSKSRPSKEYK